MQIQPEAPVGRPRRGAANGSAFGLLLDVDSRIEIPGVPSLDAAPLRSQVPTRVRLDPRELERRWNHPGHTSKRVRELRDGATVLFSVELAPSAGYLLHAPGFGRILITPDGTEMLCDPEPGSSEWSTLLPAQALPLAATLRGFEVLHASGVVLRGRAALFTGPPGAGKSSLAAALLHRDTAELLSDDTVALEPRGDTLVAHPGAALLQLRAGEQERLSARGRAVLGSPEMFLGKQRYNPDVTGSPVPFGELFLLERSQHGPPLERIETIDPFALLASTFNLSVRTPERLTRHLDLAVALAATKRIFRLRIQPSMDAAHLAEVVYEHLAAA